MYGTNSCKDKEEIKMKNKQNQSWISFVWMSRSNRISIVVGILLLVFALILFVLKPQMPQAWKEGYGDYLDPLLAVGTLLAAGVLWLQSTRKEFHESWPKKLHVVYALYDEDAGKWKAHLQILNAPLAGESDIRAWGQSLAQTALGCGRIEFSGFRILAPRTDTRKQNTIYSVLVFLTKAMSENGVVRFDDSGANCSRLEQVPAGEAIPQLAEILKKTPKPNVETKAPKA